MARPVLGIATTHIAAIVRSPQIAPPDEAGRFRAGFETLADALARAAPDALVVISPDHVNRFFLDNMPAFCIGLRDSFVGPAEEGTGIPRRQVSGHVPLATGILKHGLEQGIDWSRAEDWVLDHGFMVPLHMLDPGGRLPVVPINVNCAAPPLPGIARCHTVGALLGEAIRAAEDGLRVAVIAAGGLSHSPGDERMGFVDSEFDERFLGLLEAGATADILALSDAEIDAAGSSTAEIRSWIMLYGLFGNRPFRRVHYEAIAAYGTGCGQCLVGSSVD